MAAAAGTLTGEASAGCPVPAEMTAALANMLEAAVAAGLGLMAAGQQAQPPAQREAGDDAGRGEDQLVAPGPDGANLPVI